ncbi:hypothetical protein AYI69_g7991 [Smittium culicis]|uniref:Uncharacterized protein n=1 Tax=Smittium culicis TaxID=133412 RepID=A0A1R1XN25_9FUNG|nr:hypothetical protein AYI69_g7991 [Smittium culicis]
MESMIPQNTHNLLLCMRKELDLLIIDSKESCVEVFFKNVNQAINSLSSNYEKLTMDQIPKKPPIHIVSPGPNIRAIHGSEIKSPKHSPKSNESEITTSQISISNYDLDEELQKADLFLKRIEGHLSEKFSIPSILKISTSGLNSLQKELLSKFNFKFNDKVLFLDSVSNGLIEATHLIVPCDNSPNLANSRTLKYLQSIVHGCWVLSFKCN